MPSRRPRAKQPFGVTVRVDLVGAKPPVWRRLVLPSTLRLDQVHGVLQAVFDWTDSHLHRFTLGDDAWGDTEKYLCPYDVEEGEDAGVGEAQAALAIWSATRSMPPELHTLQQHLWGTPRQPLADLLTAAGWVTGGGGAVDPYAPGHAASDAVQVLDVAGAWREIDWRTDEVTPVGRALALAHAALVSAR